MKKEENEVEEDKERDINPDDINFKHPAKEEQPESNENISKWHKENDLSQMTYQENSDPTISQIDKGTVALQEEKLEKKDSPSDARDDKDSLNDWNAEKNESGRRK